MTALLKPTHTAPRPPHGEHEITLFPDWANDEPVVCHYEHVPGEPMTRDHPGAPDEYNLISAYIRGWDCYRLLSNQQITELEIMIEERS